jgi:hypothetical protein
MLDVWLCFYGLGLGTAHDRVIAIVHGCLAAIHLAYLFWMIGWSLKKRRLVFAVGNAASRVSTEKQKPKGRWIRKAIGIYDRAMSSIGLLGVDGPYFDLVLLCREVIETALQTQQGYRMSTLVPRTELNRVYAALLVVNCWSTALAHSVFRVNATKRRLLAVVCDCVLDLVTSVGITSVLLAIYYADFDSELTGFPNFKWYEDVWVVHVVSEFQILLVTSWGDLTLRVIFALSMISNMNNMKKLVSARLPRARRKSRANAQATQVQPFDPRFSDVSASRTQSKLDVVVASESRFTRLLFFMWGAAILVIHLYAESVPELPQCKMQVKPWITSEPSCSLLVLDCYASSVSGMASEITPQWSSFDPKTTVRVVIRHCPRLEVPEKLTSFSRLHVLKVYNSTIVSWSSTAAISQQNHPELIMLYFVRVNMTNGQLPAGLQGDDIPQSLGDTEFCFTNLRTLPDDFDLKWHQSSSIYFEACEFTEVPPALARLAPYDLSLALNPLSSLPSRIFEGNVGYIHVGGTLITQLPQIVADVSTLRALRVDNTKVALFWDWIDPIVANAAVDIPDYHSLVLASNSPYCSDLQQIYGGKQDRFSAQAEERQSRYLMDASPKNWETLRATVACESLPSTWYPIEHEDEYSGIKVG